MATKKLKTAFTNIKGEKVKVYTDGSKTVNGKGVSSSTPSISSKTPTSSGSSGTPPISSTASSKGYYNINGAYFYGTPGSLTAISDAKILNNLRSGAVPSTKGGSSLLFASTPTTTTPESGPSDESISLVEQGNQPVTPQQGQQEQEDTQEQVSRNFQHPTLTTMGGQQIQTGGGGGQSTAPT